MQNIEDADPYFLTNLIILARAILALNLLISIELAIQKRLYPLNLKVKNYLVLEVMIAVLLCRMVIYFYLHNIL
ncbi:hypothetical protein XBKB1_3970014 [Xenorhabdus bovienii str. kraussei Becker Underwood]|uniref:Uncharacterized protein n=1 Tax=Xenorhabdus bovienii str. kraussei Becker Underwood TaxID=1398204 RepID=A0A077PXD3_XENBV|nr:hypothetical protein XBKB1_3970014 [Xenorhabdus bovienii str. kraussei Becker Underwood]